MEEVADEQVRVAVAQGRLTCAQIVEDLAEWLEDEQDAPEDPRALGWRLTARHFAGHLAAQSEWTGRTDSDRLTDAFRALDAAGIVAREDFQCCQNCGVSAIGAESRGDDPPRGYVFYHGQDAERAAAGESLWLAYGRFGAPPDEAVGAEVADALRAEGLTVDWDGEVGRRIRVPMRWALRRRGRMAAYFAPVAGDPAADVEVVAGRYRPGGPMTAGALAAVELPWLPAGVTLRVGVGGRETTLRREHERLVTGDGREADRFAGLALLTGGEAAAAPRERVLDVRYEPGEDHDRPMTVAEMMDVVRRQPTRNRSWLSAKSPAGGIVQTAWEEGQLWLETPRPDEGGSLGKFATLEEAERTLAILAGEGRVAVADLPGAAFRRW